MQHLSTNERRRTQLVISKSLVLTFAALAALILSPLFGTLAALVFLMAGGVLLILRPGDSLQDVMRHWPLLILPVFCTASVVWSDYPPLTLRYGIQLGLTVVIAIVIASRLSPSVFVRCLFGIYATGIVGSILFGHVRGDTGAWVGIFGSKNAFAGVVAGFGLTSIAILLDRTAPRWLRFLALIGSISSLPLLLKAQSTGALMFMLPAAAVGVTVAIGRSLSKIQKVLAAAFSLAVLSAVAVLIVGYGDLLLGAVLDGTGKDVTLTGRTDLWDYALYSIGQRPLLGVGYQAFWVRGNMPAENFWYEFGIASKSGFHFHNMYLSNAVEIGLIGVAIQVGLLVMTGVRIVILYLRGADPAFAYFASALVFVLCASLIEVPVFFQFNITTVIAVCAYVYTSIEVKRTAAMRLRRYDSQQFSPNAPA